MIWCIRHSNKKVQSLLLFLLLFLSEVMAKSVERCQQVQQHWARIALGWETLESGLVTWKNEQPCPFLRILKSRQKTELNFQVTSLDSVEEQAMLAQNWWPLLRLSVETVESRRRGALPYFPPYFYFAFTLFIFPSLPTMTMKPGYSHGWQTQIHSLLFPLCYI